MPNDRPDARALSLAMSEIGNALKDGVRETIAHLPLLRLKVMKALNAFIRDLDLYCARLDRGDSGDRAVSTAIRADVGTLMGKVSDHVARWTPGAIAADPEGYERASEDLRNAMRRVMRHGSS